MPEEKKNFVLEVCESGAPLTPNQSVLLDLFGERVNEGLSLAIERLAKMSKSTLTENMLWSRTVLGIATKPLNVNPTPGQVDVMNHLVTIAPNGKANEGDVLLVVGPSSASGTMNPEHAVYIRIATNAELVEAGFKNVAQNEFNRKQRARQSRWNNQNGQQQGGQLPTTSGEIPTIQ